MVIGECGIPMDINRKKAFDSGDYRHHTNFLDAVISALDSNLVSFTLWNYNPANTNEFGDHWNGEDFSIFSPTAIAEADQVLKSLAISDHHSQQALSHLEDSVMHAKLLSHSPERESSYAIEKIPHVNNTADDIRSVTSVDPSPGLQKGMSHFSRRTSMSSAISPHSPFDISQLNYDPPNAAHNVGGRALDAVIRPYAAKIAGTPISMSFQLDTLTFQVSFYSLKTPVGTISTFPDINLQHTTEIYVPTFHYSEWDLFQIHISDGVCNYDPIKETIWWTIDPLSEPVSAAAKPWFGIGLNQSLDRNVHTLKISKRVVNNRWWG